MGVVLQTLAVSKFVGGKLETMAGDISVSLVSRERWTIFGRDLSSRRLQKFA